MNNFISFSELCTFFIYVMIGALSGISMGIIGVGAGMITIPLLIYTGLTVKQAVGISLIMQLLPQSLPGVMLYYKNKDITARVFILALYVVLGSLIGIYVGAYLVQKDYVTEKIMYTLLSILLISSGLYIIYDHLLYTDKIPLVVN